MVDIRHSRPPQPVAGGLVGLGSARRQGPFGRQVPVINCAPRGLAHHPYGHQPANPVDITYLSAISASATAILASCSWPLSQSLLDLEQIEPQLEHKSVADDFHIISLRHITKTPKILIGCCNSWTRFANIIPQLPSSLLPPCRVTLACPSRQEGRSTLQSDVTLPRYWLTENLGLGCRGFGFWCLICVRAWFWPAPWQNDLLPAVMRRGIFKLARAAGALNIGVASICLYRPRPDDA